MYLSFITALDPFATHCMIHYCLSHFSAGCRGREGGR